MDRIPVDSTDISSVGYNPDLQILEVQLKRNRAIYTCEIVTETEYLAFMDGNLNEKYFNDVIIHRHANAMRAKCTHCGAFHYPGSAIHCLAVRGFHRHDYVYDGSGHTTSYPGIDFVEYISIDEQLRLLEMNKEAND